jgi:hypothetical protein
MIAGVLLLGAMAGLLAIALKDPRTHGLGVLCPSRRFLGIYCPGCGTTRATYDLLHGEFARAFRSNPLFVILGAPLVAVFIGSLGWTVLRAERLALRVPHWLALAAVGSSRCSSDRSAGPCSAQNAWRCACRTGSRSQPSRCFSPTASRATSRSRRSIR